MLKPVESIDYLFIRSFCEEDDSFDMDLPLVIRDLFIHEREKILEYSGFIYADDDMSYGGALSGLRYKFLNVLLAAARHGSDYAAEMICRIYKIYYKKEYNQLKRFKTMSYDELQAFDNGEELFATIAARILTVAPFMGIDVDKECEYAVEEIEEILEDRTLGYKAETKFFNFKEGVFEHAKEGARDLLDRFKKENPNYFFDNDVQKFMWKIFEYHGVSSDFDILCKTGFEPDEREYSVTIALLRSVWPKRVFSDREVELFRAIYRSWTIFIEHLGFLDEKIDLMIGRTDKFEFELENSKYNPVKQKIARSVAGGKPEVSRVTSGHAVVDGVPEKEKENLYAEIEQLRAALRSKEQTISQLNRMYRESAEREKQNRIDQESWDGDREELKRLREQVYRMTQKDIPGSEISQEEMEGDIRGRKIVIVGGHDNWTGFPKEKFPSWSYIKPGAVNTVPENTVIQAEFLFFFTDTISHGAYNKFLKTVRTHGIRFGYLHGTNIPTTIRQIYTAVNE